MNTVWIDAAVETPKTDIKDEFLTFGYRSEKVLVQIQRSTAMGGNYHALAVYRKMVYPRGLGDRSFWDVEFHTGDWDSHVIGWLPIPQILNQPST